MSDPRPAANEDWFALKRAMKEVGNGSEQAIDAEMGRHVLHGDLGRFRDEGLTNYYLDEDTRDRLIAHARQDASHAVIVASRTSKRVRQLWWMAVVILGLLLAILVRQ